ncbi:COG1361 S-layer family protein [Candidatus Woesearchaeota archaeon]|nr:COG1361 S-layer family protein [Candidatus Woesearchaeota archaeon]
MNKAIVLLIILSLACTFTHAVIGDSSVLSLTLVNQDPDPASAGGEVEVRIGIENSGGQPADNVVIELAPEYPFTLVPGQNATQVISRIDSYQEDEDMKIIKYKLKIDQSASKGTYELKVKQLLNGATITKTFLVDLKSKESVEVIHIDKTTLIPGQESDLMFIINNVGNAPLSDLSFRWENTDNAVLPVGSDNTRYIKNLDVGDSVEIQYSVIADTNMDPGLYKLNLYLNYDDPINGTPKQISTIAGVYIGGKTDFEVSFSDTSGTETSFSIANVGSNPAYSVTVSVPDQKGVRVTGSKSSIIGNLNNGDYTVASFELGGTIQTLNLQIAYTDTMGIRQTVMKDVELNNMNTSAFGSRTATSPTATESFNRTRTTQSNNSYIWGIAGIVIFIVAIVGYKYYKTRPIKKKT